VRKHFSNDWVCRSTPDRGVVHLEARLLRNIVEKGVRIIRSASSCACKAQKAITLGDLCTEAGHPMWAMKVWKFTLGEIHEKDWNDWIDVTFRPEYVRLGDVISDGNCEVIGRRIDDVERRLGLSDARGRDSWEYRAGDGWYDMLRFEKYDYDWPSEREDFIRERDEAIEAWQREQLFREAQTEHAAQPQDFFSYWNGRGEFSPADLRGKIDDWD